MEKKYINNSITAENFAVWLTGFTDGQGIFSISFNKRAKFKSKLEVRPSFSINQSSKRIKIQNFNTYIKNNSTKSLCFTELLKPTTKNLQIEKHILEDIQTYFQCGFIRKSKIDNMYKYEVRNLQHLHEKIIYHFDKYPLLTSKKYDFKKFKCIVYMMKKNQHKNIEYLEKIIELAYTMNLSGKKKVTKTELLQYIS